MAVSKKTFEAWGWVDFCGDCGEPIVIDLCERLGYNVGTDGHFCSTKEEAERILSLFQEENADLFDGVAVARLTIVVE